MNYYERLQNAIEYIETHLTEEIFLEEVAAKANFSAFHFHRVFHSETGHTVGQYIRKRRLAKAAHELISTDRKIIDIAFDCQYDAPESFSRAFNKAYGKPPKQFRKNPTSFQEFEMIDVRKTATLRKEKRRSMMTSKVNPIPEGFRTITPYIVVNKGAEAIEFYKKAFGARELKRFYAPDGKKVFHAVLQIGDAMLMLSDEFSEGSSDCIAPQTNKGTTVILHIYTDDTDRAFKQAVDTGCVVTCPLHDSHWGDRFGAVTDPYGHAWSFGTQIAGQAAEEQAQC
ncbi:helix-turn-helix domain-containing protein [Planctomycetota bacterium]